MAQASNAAVKLAVHRYVRQIRRDWRYTMPGLLLPGFGNIFVGYIPPLIVAAILRHFAGGHPSLTDMLPYIGLFMLAWFGGEMIWRIGIHFLNRADSRGMDHLYNEAMQDLAHKDLQFFHDNFAGSLTKKVTGYGKSFEGFVDTMAFNVLAYIIPALFAFFILWRFSPWLVIGLLILIVVMYFILLPLIRRRQRLVHEREVASNKMIGYVADVIGNMDAVQAFGHEDFELRQHARNVAGYTTKARRSWDYHNLRIDMAVSPFYVLINAIGLALAITFGHDAASLTAIFITFSYYTSITRIMWEFNRIFRNIENAITEAAQFTELLLVPDGITNPGQPIKLNITKGEIEFRDVNFAYDNNPGQLFEDLNLHIKPGEKLALVGHSGGGKTTVTRLLLRFVDVNSGELLIDGSNIAHGTLHELRRSIAYVPQEPIMFHRTLRENIRYGQLDATEEQVRAAAKRAHAHEFINQLPHGYDTLVGERGVKLSGGQRQRIAIARAMIKDAPILILDEATSALDSESEKLIQEALWSLMEGRTAIVIAHRLSTIQRMDRIIVLEDGHIAEQGTHAELLKHGGIYAKLWSHQSGGFIDEDD